LKQFLFLSIIFVFLIGCGVKTPNDLRQNHEGKIHFIVNKGYQEVYRNIVEYEEMPVHETCSELYTDIKSGKIYLRGVFTPFYSFVLIDIIHIEPEITEVNYYYYFPVWKDLGDKIKKRLLHNQ